MARRRTDVKRYLWASLVIPILVACSASHPEATTGGNQPRSTSATSLSQHELSAAAAVARHQIAKARATVYSVTVRAGPGRVKDSNTGHPCASGRLLTIKLIGRFPHTVTTGHPVRAGQPAPDFTVRAEIITADAETGTACLIGVQTAEHG